MSFRELRNFCEIMRSLGYPRTISMENFRVPNFKLAAEIIYWLAKRFDPKADIPDDIEDESSRIEFVKKACAFFYAQIKTKLNAKKVYAADGHCVQELLKVADVLYKAKRSVTFQNDYEFGQELDITSRKNDIENVKNLSGEIVELGLNLLDLLDKEKGLKQSRDAAIEYLDGISKNYNNAKDEEIEKKIMGILSGQEKALEQLDSHVSELKGQQNELSQELQMKKVELERAEKRLESLHLAQPQHLSEMNQYENDLSMIYRLYVEKIRNHDYLQSRVDKYQKMEELKQKDFKNILESNKAMEKNNLVDQNELIAQEGNYEEEEEQNKQDLYEGAELQGEPEQGGDDDEFDDDDDHF